MKERRHASPGKQQESTRPREARFDFGPNDDAKQWHGKGEREEESPLLLEVQRDDKQLLDDKPNARARGVRTPAAPPAAAPPGAPSGGPPPEAAVAVESAEEEVEAEVAAEGVERETPAEEPLGKPAEGGAPAAPPADGPGAPTATPAAPVAPPAAPLRRAGAPDLLSGGASGSDSVACPEEEWRAQAPAPTMSLGAMREHRPMLPDPEQLTALDEFVEKVIANANAEALPGNDASGPEQYLEPAMPIFADAAGRLTFDSSRIVKWPATWRDGHLRAEQDRVRASLRAWQEEPPPGQKFVGIMHGHTKLTFGAASPADQATARHGLGMIDGETGAPTLPEVVYGTVGQEGGTTLMHNGDVADPASSLGYYAGTSAGGERAFAPTCSPDELAAPLRPSRPAIGLPGPTPTPGPGK